MLIVGYTTQTHGSHKGGKIDAIQLETPKHLRNELNSPGYAQDVASAIYQYLYLHYENCEKRQPVAQL